MVREDVTPEDEPVATCTGILPTLLVQVTGLAASLLLGVNKMNIKNIVELTELSGRYA